MLAGKVARPVPWWVVTLEQAAEWGVPPWEIDEHMTVLWDLRWKAYRNETARAQRDKATHGK